MIKKLFLIALVLFAFNFVFANTSPILSNFRIENSNKNRVYFDSSDPITAATTNGFTISGKTITAITINSGQTNGHYFTVSSAFTFWDNNTIRYDGGGDLRSNGGTLHNFTLEYITNYIPEPIVTGSVYYVATDGSDSNNGTSINTPFKTWTKAFQVASAGSTIWIKAGRYTGENYIDSENEGTVSNPIVVKGYKNTIGDLDNVMYYNHTKGASISASEMPVLDGQGTTNSGLHLNGKDYFIIKNLQFTGYKWGCVVKNSVGALIENSIFKDNQGHDNGASNAGIGLSTSTSKGGGGSYLLKTNYRIKDCIAVNNSMASIWITGSNNLIENVKVYSDIETPGVGDHTTATDYAITVQGDNNIVRNSRAERYSLDVHYGHGIGVRGPSYDQGNWGVTSTYNLIEKSYATAWYESFYIRNYRSDYNVIKDCEVSGLGSNSNSQNLGSGIAYYGFVKNNISERMNIHDIGIAIYNIFTVEDGTTDYGTTNNIIRNSVFNNAYYLFLFATFTDGSQHTYSGNHIQNSTFNNISYFAKTYDNLGDFKFSDNEFVNCIFNGVQNELYSSSTWDFDKAYTARHSNFYGGFAKPDWASNSSSIDPKLDSNLKLTPATPESIYDGGADINSVNYDKDKAERTSGKYSIGAYDDATPTIGSVSPDVNICVGESTTMVASGGDSYLWNTGETTASLSVSPTITSTYSVTVTDSDGNSDSHDVTVTVNSVATVDAGSDVSICEGESVTLIATGSGDFLWNTGETTASITVNPSNTTTYSVTASNSCATDATDQVIVTVSPGVALDAGSDVSICEGESVTLTATGSGDFLWSTGETTSSIMVNPNSTTTYSITSVNGSCTETDEVIVTVNSAATVDAGSDVSICQGESVTLTATGSGDFLWSTGETTASITVSPNSTTTYSVTATSSCASSSTVDDVIVTVEQLPTLSVSEDVTIDEGESVTLTASGTGDFLWSTGETTSSITVKPSVTTQYTVVLTTDIGCSNSTIVTVTVVESADGATVVAYAGEDVTICAYDKITLTASGGDSYEWSTGETKQSITVEPSESTIYSVKVISGESSDIAFVKVTIDDSCSSVVEQEMIVYPNPTEDIINLDLSGYSNRINIQIYSLNGNMIYSKDIKNNQSVSTIKHQIDLSVYAKGVYFIRLFNKGKIETKKIMHI